MTSEYANVQPLCVSSVSAGESSSSPPDDRITVNSTASGRVVMSRHVVSNSESSTVQYADQIVAEYV